MKRSEAVSEILDVLKKWENCKMERRTAKAVLKRIESLGFSPPFHNVLKRAKQGKKKGYLLFSTYGWEPEGKKK